MGGDMESDVVLFLLLVAYRDKKLKVFISQRGSMYAHVCVTQVATAWEDVDIYIDIFKAFLFFKGDLNNIVILCVENLSFSQQSPIQASLCQPYNVS